MSIFIESICEISHGNLKSRAGTHNHFAIAGRFAFMVMNYDRQWVQDIYIVLHCFCYASTYLFGRLSTEYPHTLDKEFSLNGRHNSQFKRHVQSRIKFNRRPQVCAPLAWGNIMACHTLSSTIMLHIWRNDINVRSIRSRWFCHQLVAHLPSPHYSFGSFITFVCFFSKQAWTRSSHSFL